MTMLTVHSFAVAIMYDNNNVTTCLSTFDRDKVRGEGCVLQYWLTHDSISAYVCETNCVSEREIAINTKRLSFF